MFRAVFPLSFEGEVVHMHRPRAGTRNLCNRSGDIGIPYGKLWLTTCYEYHYFNQNNPIEPLIRCKKADVNTAEACSLQL